MVNEKLKIAFFFPLVCKELDSKLPYFRGILSALSRKGYEITIFYSTGSSACQKEDLSFAESVIFYDLKEEAIGRIINLANACDIVIKVGGESFLDEFIEAAFHALRDKGKLLLYWNLNSEQDLKVFSTKDSLKSYASFHGIFSIENGEKIEQKFKSWGNTSFLTVGNGISSFNKPITQNCALFSSEMACFANTDELPENFLEEFILTPAKALPHKRFMISGTLPEKLVLPHNVKWLPNLTVQQNEDILSSAASILISGSNNLFNKRELMLKAVKAGTVVLTNIPELAKSYFKSEDEIFVLKSGKELVEILKNMSKESVSEISLNAFNRITSTHTYYHRAEAVSIFIKGLLKQTKSYA